MEKLTRGQKWFCVLGASFIVAMFFLSRHRSIEALEIIKNGESYVGVVGVSGKYVTCTFKWRDGSYQKVVEDAAHGTIVDGERYRVYWWDKFPDRYVISFTEPVIDSSFSKIDGAVVKQRGRMTTFTYTVLGKEYKRFQLVNERLVAGKSYPVYYKRDFPRIAYVSP